MRKTLFLLGFLAFSFVSAFGQGALTEILKRMDAHQKALKTLQSDIAIIKFTAQSGGTFTKEGVIRFVAQGNDHWLRIDSTKPAPENFLVIKNEYLVYLPNLKTAYTGKSADSQKNMLLILTLSRAGMKTDYNIKYIGTEKLSDTISTWKLELTPKTAKSYKTLELWINNDGMPLQSRIIENNDDWTIVLLGNPQKNIVLKGNDFKIDLPKGTKIIKN